MDFTINTFLLSLGLGLLGFIEPCSIGSTLVVAKHLEGKDAISKLTQVGVFALTRAISIGLLGMVAVVLGASFLGFQRSAWIFLGVVYVLIGLLYLVGKASALMVSLGPKRAQLSDARGAAILGLLFGLNIPACAAPLIFALLGAAAAGGTAGATLASGFISLAVFGLALSLPLIMAVSFERARRALDRLATLSERVPFWTGIVFVVLGAWSVWFGLFVTVTP